MCLELVKILLAPNCVFLGLGQFVEKSDPESLKNSPLLAIL